MAGFLPRLTALLGADATDVVSSDHGENASEHGLLDHQFSLHDTVLREPLLVRYPGGDGAGDECAQLVQSQHPFATVLALSGVHAGSTASNRVPSEPPRRSHRNHVTAQNPGP